MQSKKSRAYGVDVDLLSYQLGKIFAFVEIVGAGVKKLALSPPLSPEEMKEMLKPAERMGQEFGSSMFLEEELLTTDLFDEAFTRGKQVLLIYKDPEVKKAYLDLKARKASLVRSGEYAGEARRQLARDMGRLLSYTEEHIENVLAKGPSRPG